MAEKEIKSRIQQKHDIEENWLKATNFIPKQGEIIIYDKDSNHNYIRIKIGDGETVINSLPFFKDVTLAPLTVKAGQTIIVKEVDDNGKPTEWEAVDFPEGGAAIVDVVELPTENIDEDVFYRLVTGTLVWNQYVQNMYTVHWVETLPEIGEPATNLDNTEGHVYYTIGDGEGYGYVDETLSAALSVSVGWYPVAILLGALGYKYAGTISDIREDPRDDKFRLLVEYVVYDYKEGNWTSHKIIGRAGTGQSAETFNHPANVASGPASHAEGELTTASKDSAHAEGYQTVASGAQSHAEGRGTTASGNSSHAEGSNTTASGNSSHAEGSNTTASGNSSHAEGSNTTASGNYDSHAEGHYTIASGNYGSHAEGHYTIAASDSQHAQGKYNIEDAAYKYAHIVGNGFHSNARSNAHTLDWDGVGWYAGGLKVGGTGQDDAEAQDVMLAPLTAKAGQTIVVKEVDENGKPTEWEAVDFPEGGAAIVDVVELPTEEIDEDVFYRVVTPTWVLAGSAINNYVCYAVNSLPEVGEPVTDASMSYIKAYYNTQNGMAYGYLDSVLSAALGFPVGWYDMGTLFTGVGQNYGGVIYDIADSTDTEELCLLLEYVVWQYKDIWVATKGIGWAGAGRGAEVFNSPRNTANGDYSHAEGWLTEASGKYSHAEGQGKANGDYSHAEGSGDALGIGSHAEGSGDALGDSSHAEGWNTTASGKASHAEGWAVKAIGAYSHAEGDNTTASGIGSHAEGRGDATGNYSHAEGIAEAIGDCSHAEGRGTIAASGYQHVQGEFNIEDTEGKYAHIVGNGAGGPAQDRSNAHTLDWDGNAWFAGDVYVGSTSGTDKDEGSKKLVTVDEMDAAIAAKPSASIIIREW